MNQEAEMKEEGNEASSQSDLSNNTPDSMKCKEQIMES